MTVTTIADAGPIRLEEGEIDLEVVFEAGTGELGLEFADHDSGEVMDPESVVLVVREQARTILPQDFPPIGAAGDAIWIVPQSPDPGVIYLGIAGDEIDPGAFDGPVELRLSGWSGPGDFLLWQSRAPGEFEVRMNTRDGIGEDDEVSVPSGGHEHFNWGFTTNGVFRLQLVAAGRQAGGGETIQSREFEVTFAVEPVPAEEDSPTLHLEWGEDGTFLLVVEGTPGVPYVIAESDAAGEGGWRPWTQVLIEAGASEASLTVSNAGEVVRFFRAQAE